MALLYCIYLQCGWIMALIVLCRWPIFEQVICLLHWYCRSPYGEGNTSYLYKFEHYNSQLEKDNLIIFSLEPCILTSPLSFSGCVIIYPIRPTYNVVYISYLYATDSGSVGSWSRWSSNNRVGGIQGQPVLYPLSISSISRPSVSPQPCLSVQNRNLPTAARQVADCNIPNVFLPQSPSNQ